MVRGGDGYNLSMSLPLIREAHREQHTLMIKGDVHSFMMHSSSLTLNAFDL